MRTLSVVIPLYNNEDIAGECYLRVSEALSKFKGKDLADYEIVFVDDGSRDGTVEKLIEAAGRDPRVTIIEMDQNYGQHAAICAGFEAAKSDIIVTLDSDLQIDPGEIPRLIGKINEGHDLVSGVRVGRSDSFVGRKLPSRLFNRLVTHSTRVRLRDWGCPTVALTNQLAKKLLGYGEMRRFLKPLGAKLAKSVAEVELTHHTRVGGSSSYNLSNLFELALDFITNFSRRPFQKVCMGGTVLFAAGFLAGIIYLILRFIFAIDPGVRLQALIFLSVIIGLQLVILGFLGEFIIRIYRKQNKLPFYSVKRVARGGEPE